MATGSPLYCKLHVITKRNLFHKLRFSHTPTETSSKCAVFDYGCLHSLAVTLHVDLREANFAVPTIEVFDFCGKFSSIPSRTPSGSSHDLFLVIGAFSYATLHDICGNFSVSRNRKCMLLNIIVPERRQLGKRSLFSSNVH